MRKFTIFIGAATLLAVSSVALAGFQPTLKNEDSKSYKYELICGGSTTSSSISANTQETLRSGCKLKVQGAGTAKLVDDMKCVIKGGTLDCE